jgi:hypothetical protein
MPPYRHLERDAGNVSARQMVSGFSHSIEHLLIDMGEP